MTELPDLRQVRSLVAVAETESFTKAAERLNVTQSAVSHSIRALEMQLEIKLVERSGKRLALTQEGSVILRRFRAALKQLESAGDDLALLKRWGQGRLRVGATHTLCHYLLPEVLHEFRKLYPRCEIHLDSGDTSELVELLDHAEIDLAFGIDGRCPTWARFDGIFQDEMVFVFSPDHEWAKLEEVDMALVEGQSFLVYAKASETYRLLKASFEKAGGRLRSSLSLGDMGAIMEMAKVGIGVGIVAPWAARKEIEKGELVSLPLGRVSRSRDWGIFCHENRQLTMVEEDFVRICRNVTQGFPGVTSLATKAGKAQAS
ncbi:MAG: LysR family transcriptional regulator [Akkermansiaceae bacterium]